MSENITSPESEIIPVTTDNNPPTSRILPIIPILLILLTLLATLAIYLFLQVRQLTLEKLTPSPTPNSSTSANPTQGLQTFSDPKLGFTFNYPSDWELTTEVTDVIELMKDHARIVITYRFDALDGGPGGPSLEGSPYELSGLKVYKYKSERDNQVEWGISDSLTDNSDLFRYIGKPYSIVLRYPSRENGERYNAEFDQILSTFKFTEGDNSEKKIGYINAIRPNYDVYAIDVDYINFIDDKTAPNGFRIDNPSTSITTLQTDFTSDTSPLITTQSNEVKTFSELIRAFDEEPGKWQNIPFWIETKNGPVMKITEQYIP